MKRKAKILFCLQQTGGDYSVLLGRRISQSQEFWWIPGGSVEAGERDFEAGLRELGEELILPAPYRKALQVYTDSQTEPVCIIYQSSNADNRIFIVPLGLDTLLLPDIKDEFEELKWFNLDHLPSNMSREFEYIRESFREKVRDATVN